MARISPSGLMTGPTMRPSTPPKPPRPPAPSTLIGTPHLRAGAVGPGKSLAPDDRREIVPVEETREGDLAAMSMHARAVRYMAGRPHYLGAEIDGIGVCVFPPVAGGIGTVWGVDTPSGRGGRSKPSRGGAGPCSCWLYIGRSSGWCVALLPADLVGASSKFGAFLEPVPRSLLVGPTHRTES
jgi:hypothetical protein